MPRRFRLNWPVWLGVVLFAGASAAYVVWPLGWSVPIDDATSLIPPHPADLVRERGMNWTAFTWFFVLGAAIGSFLNVVAYRMPMGLTIVSKPSRCPYCMTPIQFRHNMPILGWAILRGRCFRCRLPISIRYPLVELAIGTLFVTLFAALVVSGGANLPIREPEPRAGVMWNLFTPQWELLSIYAFHAFLLSTMATVALIKIDALRVPVRLVLFASAVGLAGRILWPALCPANLGAAGLRWLDPLAGLAGGAALGTVCQLVRIGARSTPPPTGGLPIQFALVGLFLGVQTLPAVLVVTALVVLLATLLRNALGHSSDRLWAGGVLVGAWLCLCFWRQLPLMWLPGVESSLLRLAVSACFGLAMVWVAQTLGAVDESCVSRETTDGPESAGSLAVGAEGAVREEGVTTEVTDHDPSALPATPRNDQPSA